MAALEALAESLRVEGDGHTRAQRRADALINPWSTPQQPTGIYRRPHPGSR